MQTASEHAALIDIVRWIDAQTAGLTLPADERSQLSIGCLDVALEHQAAIALLHSSELYGSMMALLRVLSESLVRGLWLHSCATDVELAKFKRGRLEKSFGTLVKEYEDTTGTSEGVLSGFKLSAWTQMNDFTHTGFLQVSRRHKPGRVEGNYPDHDLRMALGVAGALGLVAAGQLIALAERHDLLPLFMEKMSEYAGSKGTDQKSGVPESQ
ncbi:DUF6988 family protein [Burkholderia ubonensis]|uniref:DUF6988 family protein n=1 Tax=Burkholderia ubonensis TaxID=101571 RepID=UPI0007557936|nr:hypothetical protein [Burkholderia ubonensis]